MKKLFYIILTLLLANQLFSQNSFSALTYDFGDLYKGDQRYVDFTYHNRTNKKNFLLSIKNDRHTRVLTSGNTIMPDSSITIRIKYNPPQKGKFSVDVPVYFSNSMEPYIFKIKGNVKEIDNSDGIECPIFGPKDIERELSFNMQVNVLDKETGLPIENASVKFITRGVVYKEFITNKKGKAKDELRIGLYYLVTTADKYISDEQDKFLNKKNNEVTIYLKRKEIEFKEKETDSSLIVVTIPEPKEEKIALNESIPLEEKKESYYAPNNIVFLLDISSSMNQQGKLDLLKASMIELTHELRDVDKITLVAYSTFSKVLLETTTGNNKDEIIQVIQDLKASGMTAGGEGMSLAYRLAKKNFIKGGNNQIIMATDGKFNRGSTNVDRLVKKNISKGIKISVLGIKNKEIYAKDMVEIAELGEGNYLHIDNYDISKKILIDEIRAQSLRKK